MSQLIAKGLSKRLQLFIDMNSSRRWRRMERAEEREIQKNKTHTINSFIKYANRATLFLYILRASTVICAASFSFIALFACFPPLVFIFVFVVFSYPWRTCVFDRFKRKYCMENILLRSQPRRSLWPLFCSAPIALLSHRIRIAFANGRNGFFSVSVFTVPPSLTTLTLPLCWLACS